MIHDSHSGRGVMGAIGTEAASPDATASLDPGSTTASPSTGTEAASPDATASLDSAPDATDAGAGMMSPRYVKSVAHPYLSTT